jgi:hypothetical protein
MNDKLKQVMKNYTDERHYLGDGYYRLKTIGDNQYEIEFSKSGYCGTFDPAPAIGFTLDENGLRLDTYRDMVSTPIKLTNYHDEPEFVSEAFDRLVDKFLTKMA